MRPDGRISLGFYGEVYVAGLTTPEVKEKIVLHLRKYINDEILGLVEIDENGDYKRDAKGEIIFKDPKETDRVFVDVTAYNSKNYYILGDVLIPGRLPITGNETRARRARNMPAACCRPPRPRTSGWSGRRRRAPAASRPCRSTWPRSPTAAIPTTNYQLMPGDRIVVHRDPIVRFTVFLDRIVAPYQAVIGSGLQTDVLPQLPADPPDPDRWCRRGRRDSHPAAAPPGAGSPIDLT